MNQKHRGTLEAIFDDPVRSNIPWRDIEGMLRRPVRKSPRARDHGSESP